MPITDAGHWRPVAAADKTAGTNIVPFPVPRSVPAMNVLGLAADYSREVMDTALNSQRALAETFMNHIVLSPFAALIAQQNMMADLVETMMREHPAWFWPANAARAVQRVA